MGGLALVQYNVMVNVIVVLKISMEEESNVLDKLFKITTVID